MLKHTIVTPEIEADIHVRNEARIKQARVSMGTKYIHHPANHVPRVVKPTVGMQYEFPPCATHAQQPRFDLYNAFDFKF